MKKFSFLFLLLLIGCTNFLVPNSKFNRALYLALGGFGLTSSELPNPINVTSKPTIVASPSLGGENSGFIASLSTAEVPNSLEGNFVPIGKIYNIGLDWSKVEGIAKEDYELIQFKNPIELKYSYDSDELYNSGFMEEFMVFYFNSEREEWLPVKGVRVDIDKKEIIAITDHFTPFVITALPIPHGTGVASSPSCINSEAPISGSGNAVWTMIDVNFKYYKDRNYQIKLNEAFSNLGLENSLGIATCNGGAPAAGFDNCGSFLDHKNFNGRNYIQFQAPKAITVYLMYDSRGPVDAPWLANDGWVNTGLTIETTDAVGDYKVFAKDFSENETVNIQGNRNGLSPPTNINTNLWLVVKPRGSNQIGRPSDICKNSPEVLTNLVNVKGIPGQDRNTILWEIPKHSNIQNVLIRKQLNHPTLSPAGGISVSGIEHSKNGFTDVGLSSNTTYFYTLFTVNSDGEYSPGKVIELRTGVDQDLDGIKDEYEAHPDNVYDSGLPSLAENSDSDQDGISDLQEIINETDPRNPDTQKPIIDIFTLASPNPTQMPIAVFNLTATDDVAITHWILREGDSVPRKNDIDWQIQKPESKLLNNMKTYNFYIWAKDAAGNISNVFSPSSITLDGLKYPKFIFVVKNATNEIKTYQYNLATKSLDLLYSKTVGSHPINQIIVHPSNQFLIAADGSGIRTLDISSDGELTDVSYIARMQPSSLKLDWEGKYLYSTETEKENGLYFMFFRTYLVNVATRSLSPHSRYKFGRDAFEMILHPLNNHFIAQNVQGSDFGDSCYYSLHSSYNGIVYNSYSIDGIYGAGCGSAVIDNSGKYLYTLIYGESSPTLRPFIIDHPYSITYSTAWSMNIDSSAGHAQILIHPDSLHVYTIRNTSTGVFVDTYEIDSNPINKGKLNKVGQPFSIGLNNTFSNGKIDSTGQVLILTHQNESISTVELNPINGLPIKSSNTSNAGVHTDLYSVNNVNEPPHVFSRNHSTYLGRVSPNEIDTIFKGYCLIGSNIGNGIWFNREECIGEIFALDTDMTRCNSSPTAMSISTLINGVSPNIISSGFNIYNKSKYQYYSFKPQSTGNYTLDYSVTDQAGNCLGGERTVTRREQIRVKRLTASPRLSILATENRHPSEFRQFVISFNDSYYSLRAKRCQLFWLECGLTTSFDQLGNVSAMRFSCEEKSSIVTRYIGWKENPRCETGFIETTLDVWLFKKRVVDLGISTTTYYRGNWLEAVD